MADWPGIETVELPEGRVHFRLAGNSAGPALLLLHCAGGNGETFYMLRPALEPHFNVLTSDLYLHGPDPQPDTDELTGAEYVRRAAERQYGLIDALRAAGRIHETRLRAMGISMGAQVAMKMAADRPALFEKMVLADTWADTFFIDPKDRFASYHREWARAHPDEVMEWVRHWMRTNPVILNRLITAVTRQPDGITKEIAKLKLPVLLLCGEEDAVTPPDEMRKLQGLIAGSELRILPGLKHLPMVEAPDRFLAQLLPFLLQPAT